MTAEIYGSLPSPFAYPTARADWVGDWLAFIFVASLYLLPVFVAVARGHLSATAIVVLDLTLGWTGLGWIVAMIWSLTGNTRANAERYAHRAGCA